MSTQAPTIPLSELYWEDETAWLDAMSDLAGQRATDELDYDHLSQYLADMGRRDRKEVYNRLVVLLRHCLKWDYQTAMRSNSWRSTIREQQRELRQDLQSGTLRNYAQEVLAEAHADACPDAAEETGLPMETFPQQCPWQLEALLRREQFILDS